MNLLPDTSPNRQGAQEGQRYQVSVLLSIEDELVRQKKLAETDKRPGPKLAGMSLKRYLELRAAKSRCRSSRQDVLILDQFEEGSPQPGDGGQEDFFAWRCPRCTTCAFGFCFRGAILLGGLEPTSITSRPAVDALRPNF